MVLGDGIGERTERDFELFFLGEGARWKTVLDELALLEIEPDGAKGNDPFAQGLWIDLRNGLVGF